MKQCTVNIVLFAKLKSLPMCNTSQFTKLIIHQTYCSPNTPHIRYTLLNGVNYHYPNMLHSYTTATYIQYPCDKNFVRLMRLMDYQGNFIPQMWEKLLGYTFTVSTPLKLLQKYFHVSLVRNSYYLRKALIFMENFHGAFENRKNRESLAQRIFSRLWYPIETARMVRLYRYVFWTISV